MINYIWPSLEIHQHQFDRFLQMQSQTLPEPKVVQNDITEQKGSIIGKVDQSLDLFTDPQSPYASADEEVKKLFSRVKDRHIIINEITHQFEKKPGKSNICTFFFPAGGEYYTCQDCCKNGGGTIMCFCLPCWDAEKHIGHSFDKRTAWSNSAYCDCGWDDRIKPQSFCGNHGSKEIIQADISQADREKFHKFFVPLFQIGLYLVKNIHHDNPQEGYWNKMSKIVIELTESSIHYIRLICEILQKQILFDESKCTILEALLKSPSDQQSMLFRIAGDKLGKFKLAKVFAKLINSQSWQESSNYSTLVRDCFTQNNILLQLAKNKIFINKYQQQYIELAEKQPEEGQSILYSYLLHQKKQKNQSEFVKFLINFWGTKGQKISFRNQDFKNFLIQHLFESYKNPQNEMNIKQQECEASLNRNGLISQLIINICKNDVKQISQFENKLEELKIQKQLFYKFLESSVKTAKKMIYKYDTPKDYRIIPIILMIISSKTKNQLIHQLWNSITKENDNLREDFVETLDVMYHLISLINNFDSFLLNQKQNKQEDDLQARIKWFKSFLYENRKTQRDDLLKMRKQGKLKFKEAGSILKQLCKYREDSDSFEYVSQQKYPNYQMKFKVRDRSKRGNFRAIPDGNFAFNQKIQVSSNTTIMIFQALFNHPNFLGTFTKKWWDKVKAHESDDRRISFWKNYDISYYYVLILVCAKQIMNTTNQQLNQELQKIRSDKKLLQKLSSYNSSQTLLKRLLSIEQQKISPKKTRKTETELQKSEQKTEQHSQQIQKKQQGEQQEQQLDGPQLTKNNSLQQRKQKFNKKKLAKYAKLKQKRNIVLNRNLSKNSNAEEETELLQTEGSNEQCLLCHEKGKKDKRLLYLGYLEKDNTLSASFHGKEDKADILFSSCFHPVHAKCYLEIQKRDMEFTCPLCSKKSNIVFPVHFSDEEIKKCQNVITALFIVKFKSLEFSSFIQLLFKHLVQSYGLNSLIYLPRYQQQKSMRRKMNVYILKIICKTYNNNTGNKKSQFQKIYDNFTSELKTCTNQLAKNVQLLVSKMVYNLVAEQKIMDDGNNLLKSIHSQIEPTEFSILKQSLQHLIGSQIVIDESEEEKINKDQKKQYKMLSFNVKKLPQTTQNLDKWNDGNCECGKSRDIFCLVSGKNFCKGQQCSALQKHSEQYKGNLILFKLSAGKVVVAKKKTGKKTEDVYFDPFMMPYSERQNGYSGEIYQLNTYKFEKITKTFFDLQ